MQVWPCARKPLFRLKKQRFSSAHRRKRTEGAARHADSVVHWNYPEAGSTEPATLCRDVAQPGRALAWGARGRQFESARPDHLISLYRCGLLAAFLFLGPTIHNWPAAVKTFGLQIYPLCRSPYLLQNR